MLPDNGLLSGHGTENVCIIPYFKIIGLYMLQNLEPNFGKQHWCLAVLVGTEQRAFLSEAALLSSAKRVNADNTGKVSWLRGGELTQPGSSSGELIEVFCSIQSRVVKHLNFPPNSVFYCTFDASFL